jgi:Flp pilus assembly protein TadG
VPAAADDAADAAATGMPSSKADAARSMTTFLVIRENLTLIPPQAVESL